MVQQKRPHLSKLSDHEAFQESTLELGRGLKKSIYASLIEVAAGLAIIIIPFCLGDTSSDWGIMFLIDAFVVLMLLSRGYELLRCRQAKAVITKQLEIAAKQRLRAEKLYDLSILDPLTGLHNRRFGEQRLKEEIIRSAENDSPLAVIVFDLDYFKEINDDFGHAVGDLALREFSRRLRRAIRACDSPVRIGGDEFLVILPDCPRENVDTILSRIGTPEIIFKGQKIAVRFSLGRAHYQYNDTSETMLARADQMLYEEKAARPEILNRRHGGGTGYDKIAGSGTSGQIELEISRNPVSP